MAPENIDRNDAKTHERLAVDTWISAQKDCKEVNVPAYAYKTRINYGREKIREAHQHELYSCSLSIALLEPIVGDNSFSITEGENLHQPACTIHWTTIRDETDNEYANRIAKAEAYNAEVERRGSAEALRRRMDGR